MFSSIAFVAVVCITTGTPEPSPKDGEKKPKVEIKQPPPLPPDLSGYYTCKGEEAGGKKYSGIVVLTKKGDVYVINWVVGGGSTFSGIGIRQGEQLAASWAIPNEKGQIVRGVNLYRIEGTTDGARLVGRWASLPGPGVQQQETLMFLKKLDPPDE